MSKVFIATPTLDASVLHDYTASAVRTAQELPKHGIELDVVFLAGCAAMDRARDMLVKSFLDSDSTHLLQVDADLGWEATDIIKMVNHDVDFISGVYPVKQEEPKFLVNFTDERNGILIGATGTPGGFCLIKREAIKKMVDTHHDLIAVGESHGINGETLCWLHTHEVSNGRVWGEDMIFCRRAMEAGIKIWVDPTINLRHWNGTKCYDHKIIGNMIKQKVA